MRPDSPQIARPQSPQRQVRVSEEFLEWPSSARESHDSENGMIGEVCEEKNEIEVASNSRLANRSNLKIRTQSDVSERRTNNIRSPPKRGHMHSGPPPLAPRGQSGDTIFTDAVESVYDLMSESSQHVFYPRKISEKSGTFTMTPQSYSYFGHSMSRRFSHSSSQKKTQDSTEAKFKRILRKIQQVYKIRTVDSSATMDEDISYLMTETFSFNYKNHPFVGQSIHIAAECHSEEHKRTVLPIHLASNTNNTGVLKILLDNGADFEAKAILNGQYYYKAIHDAAWGGAIGSVQILIEECKDKNIEALDVLNPMNKNGQTPIHLAGMQGHDGVVRILLQAMEPEQRKQVLETRDKPVKSGDDGNTPLMLAVKEELFPPRHLKLLAAEKDMATLLDVAHLNHNSAAEMMESEMMGTSGDDIGDDWKDMDVKVDQWVELMRVSPRAAERVLEMMTRDPEVEDLNRHSLPRTAVLQESLDYKKCVYEAATQWHYNSGAEIDETSRRKYPKWHDELAPQEPSHSKQLAQVEFVSIPCFAHVNVVYSLCKTKYKHIFATLAVQGLLDFMWKEGQVREGQVLRILHMLLELVCAFMLTIEEIQIAPRYYWSIYFAGFVQSFMLEVFNFYREAQITNMERRLCTSGTLSIWKNKHDITYVALLGSLCYLTRDTYDVLDEKEVFSMFCLVRWIHLLLLLRGFELFGKKMAPIIASFQAMDAIACITLFAATGIYHSYRTLTPETEGKHRIMAVYRLLFLDDMEPLQTNLHDEDAGFTYLGGLSILCTFGFNICLLNLFIAIHSDAYEKYQTTSTAMFYQKRADIILKTMNMPTLPKCVVMNKRICVRRLREDSAKVASSTRWVHRIMALMIFGVGIILWAWCLQDEAWPPTIGGACLAAFGVTTQCTKTAMLWWDEDEHEGKHLWVCHHSAWSSKKQSCGPRLSIGDEEETSKEKGKAKRIAAQTKEKVDDLHTIVSGLLNRLETIEENSDQKFEKIATAISGIHDVLSKQSMVARPSQAKKTTETL